MTLGGALERLETAAGIAVRLLQAGLVAIMVYGAAIRNPGLVTNAGMSLLVALLPAAIHRWYGYRVHDALALWIATAAFLHAVGALGPYRWLGWYDQVTHTLSASLVAGAGYAIAVAIDRAHDGVTIPPRLRAVFILLFVLAFGVLWEIAEFATGGIAALVGGEAALAQYGVSDIALDLLFNAVGAVVVAVWGTDHFRGLSRLLARRLDRPESDR